MQARGHHAGYQGNGQYSSKSLGTGYQPEKFFEYRWVLGTDQIFNDADPWFEQQASVVNLRLDKLGRAVPTRKFKWTEPGRSGPKFLRARPFLSIFREDFADIPPYSENNALFEMS